MSARTALAVGGLVSVPTTHTGSGPAFAQRAAELQKSLRATDAAKRGARLSRLRRAVGFSARAIGADAFVPGFRPCYVAMLTLTYADGDDWRPQHLTRFMTTLREFMRRRGVQLRYVWVAELQRRGALHYHLALWLPHGFTIPMPDKCGWWSHGSTRIEEAKAAVPYLLKYFSKGTDTTRFPKGARVHGSGGLDHATRRAKRWLSYPSFVKARADIFDDWTRAAGGGWSDPDGIVIPSEYERSWVGDRWCVVPVAQYPKPFEASGPFTWLARRPEVTQ